MSLFDVGAIVSALHDARDEWRDSQRRSREPGSREFPSRDALVEIVESLKGALFPMRLGPPDLRHEIRVEHLSEGDDGHFLRLRIRSRRFAHEQRLGAGRNARTGLGAR